MKLVVSGRAARRLHDISAHIRGDNPAAARDVQRALDQAFALLVRHPFMGRPFDGQVRRFALPRLPYVIFYRPDEAADELTIVTIRHTSQRPL